MAAPIELRSLDGDPLRIFTGDVIRLGATADGCDLHVVTLPAGAYVDLIRQRDDSWTVHAVGVTATPDRLALGDTLELAGRRWVVAASALSVRDDVAVAVTYGPPPSPAPGRGMWRWIALAVMATLAAGAWWLAR